MTRRPRSVRHASDDAQHRVRVGTAPARRSMLPRVSVTTKPSRDRERPRRISRARLRGLAADDARHRTLRQAERSEPWQSCVMAPHAGRAFSPRRNIRTLKRPVNRPGRRAARRPGQRQGTATSEADRERACRCRSRGDRRRTGTRPATDRAVRSPGAMSSCRFTNEFGSSPAMKPKPAHAPSRAYPDRVSGHRPAPRGSPASAASSAKADGGRRHHDDEAAQRLVLAEQTASAQRQARRRAAARSGARPATRTTPSAPCRPVTNAASRNHAHATRIQSVSQVVPRTRAGSGRAGPRRAPALRRATQCHQPTSLSGV